MQGTNRRLINPPTTLREHEAQLAAQARERHEAAVDFRHVLSEPTDLHDTAGSITVRAYDSISVDRWVVSLHCGDRFVLWADSDAVREHARALLVLADHVDQLNREHRD